MVVKLCNDVCPRKGEEVSHEEKNCGLWMNGELVGAGSGKLILTTERIVWLSAVPPCRDGSNASSEVQCDGMREIQYRDVSLHAISRDTSNFPHPCLYCQLVNHEDPQSEELFEVRFVPEEPDALQALFEKFSEMALLHPDPVEQETEDDDENESGVEGDIPEGFGRAEWSPPPGDDEDAAMEDA